MATYCSHCGKELREGALFCRFCGTSVNEPAPAAESPDQAEKNDPLPEIGEPASFVQNGMPEVPPTPAPAPVQNKDEKKPFPAKIVIIIAAVTALIALAAVIFYFSGGSGSSKADPADSKKTEQAEEPSDKEEEGTETEEAAIDKSEVSVLGRDINFSQVPDLDSAPVDVLLKVKNTGNVPLKAVDYKITYEGNAFSGRDGKEGKFYAYGYVKPGESGYLYGQIAVPEGTPRKQGDVSIISAYAGKDLGDYQMPSGKVVQFNPDPDTYDVSINNPNSSDVHKGRSVVIAVVRDSNKLAGAWGCGMVNETIPAGEEIVLKDVIYDPGFSYKITDKEFTAFVIEKDIIGIQ